MTEEQNSSQRPSAPLGDVLEGLRVREGLTQIELAARFGTSSASSISNWEAGEVIPQPATLKRYANEFDVDLRKLNTLRTIAKRAEKQRRREGSSSSGAAVDQQPGELERGAGADQPRDGVRRSWWPTRPVLVGAIAAFGLLLVVVTIAVLASSRNSDGLAENQAGVGRDGDGATFVEYADNRAGSPVFGAPDGSRVTGAPSRIPFNTKVRVACHVPNTTGTLTSVTAFYRIVGGRWDGNYVVSDTMTNGGPPENTDAPDRDPRVPRCGRC